MLLLDLDPLDMKLNIIGAEYAPSPKMFVANTEMEVSLSIEHGGEIVNMRRHKPFCNCNWQRTAGIVKESQTLPEVKSA